MLQPVTHSWRYAQPTGIGLDPRAYLESQSIGGMGMGDVSTQQISALAATGASTTIAILGTLGVVSGPVGAAIVGVIAIANALANMFHGCGQTCIQASNIANQIEQKLIENLNTYLSAPVHYYSLQQAALNNFDFTWAALVQACGNPQLAAAGQRCTQDREAGSCKWKASPGGWANGVYTPYGPAGSGDACWNWFKGYRDPIALDPTVVPDPVVDPITGNTIITNADGSQTVISGNGNVAGQSPASSGFPLVLLLGGALLLIGVSS